MSVQTCQSCGAQNNVNARFCKACGESLVAPEPANHCPACQAANKPDAKFCRVCGHSFAHKDAPALIHIDDIALVSEPMPSSSPPLAPQRVQPEPASQFPLKWVVGGVIVVLILVAAGWWWLQGTRKPSVVGVGLPTSSTVQSPTAVAQPEAPQSPVTPPPVTAEASAVTSPSAQQDKASEAKPTAQPPVSSPPTHSGAHPSAPQNPATRQATEERRSPRPPAPVATATLLPASGKAAVESTASLPVAPAPVQPPPNVPHTPAAAPPEAKGPASPAEVCGKRVLLAQAMCMQRECNTPRFAQHPQCIQLKQQQLELERNRQLAN